MALQIETKPAPGVMATRPATKPVEPPTKDGCPVTCFSIANHENIAAAAETWVVTSAWTAKPLAAKADPALKPNQPNHKRPAPNRTKGTL